MTPPLSVVPTEPRTESVGARIRRLQSEARLLARDHVRSLISGLEQLEALASAIAEGGGAYHDGAQERARRIAMELASQRATLEAIMGRAS